MSEQHTLRDLYDRVIGEYPKYNHDPNVFIRHILLELNEDPIRTSSTRRSLERSGLEFRLPMDMPNDFVYGSRKYLESIGVTKKEAGKFDS